MTAVPGLDSRSALAPPATVGASRDAGFGLVSQGGAVDSESAAIAMASLCLKAGLAPRPRSPGAAASASILVGYDIDCCTPFCTVAGLFSFVLTVKSKRYRQETDVTPGDPGNCIAPLHS